MKGFILQIVFTLLVTVCIVAFGVFMFNVIYNSDLPTWLKWLLLRG